MLYIVVLVSVITPILTDVQNESKPANLFTKKPILIEKSVNSDGTLAIDYKRVADKLVSAILLSKKRIDYNFKGLDAINELFKFKNMYRIEYLVSFVNKLQMRVSDLYRSIEKNKYNLDALKLLEAYEEVIYSSNFIANVLTVLTQILSSQMTEEPPLTGLDRLAPPQKIAWSYYDDSLM